MFDLNGKVALVTGAASGIGLAYVHELLKNGLKGVALIDVNPENGQKVLDETAKVFGKNRVIFVKADVSNKAEFEEAFQTTVRTFNQLDIVINNAGIVQEVEWEKSVSVNFVAPITGMKLAMEKYFPKYKSGSEGVILNTASLAGLEPIQGMPVYSSTKFGVVGLTRAFGGELHYKTTNTRVVAICPGLTYTPAINFAVEIMPESYRSSASKAREELIGQKPEELAKNIVGLIREAPTGSVWLAIGGECKEIEFPKYTR